MKCDDDIQDQVQQELRWDGRVEAAEIGVAVDAGVVRLSGTVGSYAERQAAETAALRVAGVLDLANDIRVCPPGHLARTDTEIARAVRSALEWNVLVPHERIQSSISQGVVTLIGTLDSWHQIADAEQAVHHLAGVRDVVNRLVVRTPEIDPDRVEAEIQRALDRRAEREARRVIIRVQDGTVTLSGAVHSLAEKKAVIGAARGTHGVRVVQDHLHLEPPASTRAEDDHLHVRLPL